ncbi:hypothetical protein [Streptomyces zagrosensis]|uniref:Uncharacterized protein n=1 Tax=Streptomyces zagrosensis TaxID=1042984 RepID=A0A7W9Q6P4_9ACTN|nr:hypothetical protein [Streptomyces zagrosensis]MBB5934555.1 hypothetical protein [Streptomyces zagrosensis]
MTYAWTPPPGTGHSLLPIGHHFDLVQAPLTTGMHLLRDTFCDAMIANPETGHCTWLIPVGHAKRSPWSYARLTRYVQVATSGQALIPHTDRTAGPGPHWVRPAGAQGSPRYLACAITLAGDLAPATLTTCGPLPIRCVCGGPVYRDEATPGTETDGSEYLMHPACAQQATATNTARVGGRRRA